MPSKLTTQQFLILQLYDVLCHDTEKSHVLMHCISHYTDSKFSFFMCVVV